jgi:type II secretory pathway pseudopilin PulG
MRLARRQRERGDTIIEVLFAVTVFAMVAVGSLSIMNQGTATAQRALEISLVRQQIDAQAEAIRYTHQAYVATYQRAGTAPTTGPAAEWIKMTNKSTGKGANGASEFGQTNNDRCPASMPGEKPFVLNARKATIATSTPAMSPPADGSMPPFAQVVYNNDSSINQAYGLWVEAVPSVINANSPGFVDFHIRACWDSPGSTAPMTLGTIVRLYEPR